MSVVCRPARAQDLEFADTLVVSSINHLTERHGFGTMAISSPPKFQSFSLRRRQRTYRTARGLAPHAVATAFRTALQLAVESGSSQVSAFLPGASEAALNTAMAHGMRIKFPMLLMSSHDFGNWAQYLPRTP